MKGGSLSLQLKFGLGFELLTIVGAAMLSCQVKVPVMFAFALWLTRLSRYCGVFWQGKERRLAGWLTGGEGMNETVALSCFHVVAYDSILLHQREVMKLWLVHSS